MEFSTEAMTTSTFLVKGNMMVLTVSNLGIEIFFSRTNILMIAISFQEGHKTGFWYL